MPSTLTSFAECWDRQAGERGEQPALSDLRQSISWREGAELTHRLARGLLALGLEPGAVVATWLPNWVEPYMVRISCERAGLIWLPIAANLRERELHGILDQAEPAVLIIPEHFRAIDYVALALGLLPKLRKPPRLILSAVTSVTAAGVPSHAQGMTLKEVIQLGSRPSAPRLPNASPDETLLIFATSGSTGSPKLAQFRVSAWLRRGQAQAELLGLSQNDVILSLTQGLGPSIVPLFAAPLVGAAVHLVDHFEPGLVVEILASLRPTIVCAVPSQLIALINHPRWPPARLDQLRIWYSAGSTFPPATAERLEATTPGIVLSSYGGMDFGGWAVCSPSDHPQVRYHTVGRPRGNTELRLVDEAGRDVPKGESGEIWGRGPCCAIGYFGDETAAAEHWTADGWFRTGDLGRWDGAGNLVIVGRKSDLIRRGGWSIHPTEVEGLLNGHPKIAKAALVGVPDSVLGERACAFVVAKPGEVVTLDEVTSYLRAQRIATFKLPERLELVPDLPSRGEKIDRAALRRTIQERVREDAVETRTSRA